MSLKENNLEKKNKTKKILLYQMVMELFDEILI